jgi:hypothetical protein
LGLSLSKPIETQFRKPFDKLRANGEDSAGMKPFWVYILRCRDGSYYIGHTDDLERRISQHERGKMPGSWRRPSKG